MDLAIERAGQHGVGVVVMGNAGHYGPAAYHAHRAIERGMVGISMTTGGVMVAPTGGAEPLLGLNPIAVAAPTGSEVPFLFDASMSSVAGNKIMLLRRVGGEVAPGWVTRADGSPVMEESQWQVFEKMCATWPDEIDERTRRQARAMILRDAAGECMHNLDRRGAAKRLAGSLWNWPRQPAVWDQMFRVTMGGIARKLKPRLGA